MDGSKKMHESVLSKLFFLVRKIFESNSLLEFFLIILKLSPIFHNNSDKCCPRLFITLVQCTFLSVRKVPKETCT